MARWGERVWTATERREEKGRMVEEKQKVSVRGEEEEGRTGRGRYR